MASQQVAGAQAKGVYAFMKHFALNDQETNRLSKLATWANEQSIREIYLKPFEMSVKQGGAGAVMSAFNYIGMEWGGSPPAVGLNGFSFAFMWTASSLNQPKIKIIKNIKKIKIIKSWVEPTEENSRGDNDSAAIRGDNN
jgi:hypothetical protein